jgi:hypothetical protein
MKSGTESTLAARAWQVLGAVVQHTSDNMLRSLAVICPFVAATPVLYSVTVSLGCVHIHAFWLIWLCIYRSIQTRARSRAVVDKVALGRVEIVVTWLRSPASHRSGLGSIPDESMWDLLWKKWHWDTFLAKYFGFPKAVSFYQCSITMLSPWTLKPQGFDGFVEWNTSLSLNYVSSSPSFLLSAYPSSSLCIQLTTLRRPIISSCARMGISCCWIILAFWHRNLTFKF